MLPRSVQIGPHNYEVRGFTPEELVNLYRNSKCDVIFGDHCTSELLIRINLTLPHSQRAETLLHEIMHGIADVTDCDFDDEESTIRALTPTLLDVLRRNPDVADFLLDYV